MTADARVQQAREYLAGARKQKLSELPPTLLIREAAELRRQLGQLLAVVDEAILLAADDSTGMWLDGSATIAPADVATVLAALDDAAEYKRDRIETCSDCTDGSCGTCEARAGRAVEYENLFGLLGSQR